MHNQIDLKRMRLRHEAFKREGIVNAQYIIWTLMETFTGTPDEVTMMQYHALEVIAYRLWKQLQ